MDDLLDLNWSAPTSSTQANKPQAPRPQKPRDAFADLLNTPPKPVDTSKLSLLEQQRLKALQQQSPSTSGSPWLTPIQANTPNLSTTPRYSPTATPSPPAAALAHTTTSSLRQNSTTSASSSSMEDLLNPFASNNNKKVSQDRSTPLNQLRNQANSTPQSDSSSQWDFDLLDSKLSNTKNVTGATTSDTPTNSHTPVLDPFDMDSLAAQETRSFTASPANRVNEIEDEDDNPLGILAEPARPKPSTPSPPPPVASQSPSLQQHSQHSSPSVTHGRIMLSEDEEDAMMAQLIDMGFSLQESKFAIEATGGHDVQAAIDLLVQNSEVAQRRQPTNINQRGNAPQKAELSQNERARDALFSDDAPAPRSSSSRRQPQQQQKQQKQSQHQQQESGQKNHASAAAAEGDDTLQHQAEKVVMQAQELGGFLYKNATSFLKTGREKVTKAVGDWQEQQREQRLRQMQEEQGGPIRPKWMKGGDETVDVSNTNTIEKFADDDDSDNEEQDMEAERRKIQEMRRIQELKQREQAAAAHKARQQQNLRKEALILEEEVYVSPSRRRGNTPSSSGKSTPRSNSTTTNGSPAPQPQQIPKSARPSQQQQKPSPQPAARSATPRERTRPVVNVSADVMAKANAARNQGNEKFKLGQFGEAEEAYSLAIDILPAGHDHQVLLCNNRAMARLKIGHYKKCVEDCDTAITLSKQSGDGSINSEGVVIEWRGQIVKSLYRKAEALESIEKYKDALATYDELVKYEGTGNLKVNQGMSRCRQALNPKKATTSAAPSKSATLPPSSQQQRKEDFMSMFDLTAATATSSSTPSTPTASAEELSKSRAVAAMRAKAAEQEAEDAEKLEKTDEVNARLLAWKAGKEQNLRALLATVDTLLWPGAQWKGAQMSELINPKKCKIIYMKAIGKVHPDKLPSDVTVEQRMLASGIFASLNEAWDAFKGQNQM